MKDLITAALAADEARAIDQALGGGEPAEPTDNTATSVLLQRVRKVTGFDVRSNQIRVVRGTHIAEVGDLKFTLRLGPAHSGLDPELELMSFYCRPCGEWVYTKQFVSHLADVGARIKLHGRVHLAAQQIDAERNGAPS